MVHPKGCCGLSLNKFFLGVSSCTSWTAVFFQIYIVVTSTMSHQHQIIPVYHIITVAVAQ